MCPTGYTSGYGYLDFYHNSVTNRCYYVEDTNEKTYTNAKTTCTSATLGGVPTTGYLFPVLSTLEFSMAAAWTGNIRNYWLYGEKASSLSCTTWNTGLTAYQTTFSSSSLYWCPGKKDFIFFF